MGHAVIRRLKLKLLGGLEATDDSKDVFTDGARLCDRVGDCDVADLGSLQYSHSSELAFMHHIDGGHAVTGCQHAVVGRGRTSSLGMAQVDGTGLVAGTFFDLLGKHLTDAAKAGVAEGVQLVADGDLTFDVGQFCAFGDHDNAEALAALPSRAQRDGRRRPCRWASPG